MLEREAKKNKIRTIKHFASVSILKALCPLIEFGNEISNLSAKRGTTDGNDAIASCRAAVLAE